MILIKLYKYIKIKESYTLINKNVSKHDNWNLHARKSEPASFFSKRFFCSSDGFYRYGVIGCHWFCLCVVVVIFVHYVTETFVNSVFRLFLHAMVHFFDIEVRKKKPITADEIF